MIDLTAPLADQARDPILDAASSIIDAGGVGKLFSLLWVIKHPEQAKSIVAEAARQIDHLRHIGTIPEKENS
jgi:hypothetical protein